jgi:hypothetical protein
MFVVRKHKFKGVKQQNQFEGETFVERNGNFCRTLRKEKQFRKTGIRKRAGIEKMSAPSHLKFS